jgi:hypothetical protein
MISFKKFYYEYHGHKVIHLNQIYTHFKDIDPNRKFIFLAGDSSLDNKYWILKESHEQAVNGYEQIIDQKQMVPDVSYHINKFLVASSKTEYVSINAAVEESTIDIRKSGLLEQDQFIKEKITDNDILIVSVGGNDIALRPSLYTAWNMVLMIYLNTISMINMGPRVAFGMNYFINKFSAEVKDYIKELIGDKKPRKVIVCMIYYPDEKTTGSWADTTLGYLGYNTNPKKLQAAIQQIYAYATSKVHIEGVSVEPFALFNVLDGTDTDDYIQRVEPSVQGGRKMGEALVKACFI